MIPLSETRFQERLRPLPAIQAEPGELRREGRLEQALPVDGYFDSMRSWREGLAPDFRRACSAGQLLFQVVGIAGYAGYFASMHTFMRLFSGALMAGTWYAIYKLKIRSQLSASSPTSAMSEIANSAAGSGLTEEGGKSGLILTASVPTFPPQKSSLFAS
jgi:hypothetical protein